MNSSKVEVFYLKGSHDYENYIFNHGIHNTFNGLNGL